MEKINIDEPIEIRPNLSANVLFHFMSELRFLCRAIEMKALFPRYCRENITYLDLKLDERRITEVAYPEKCFCDIPVHKVLEHTSNYGEYGIGLPKDWGIKQGIQPIQYVNPKSHLIRDFRKAFEKRTTISEGNYDAQYISNYLVSYTTAGYLMDGDEMGFDADVMQLAMMLQEMKNEDVKKVAIEQVKVLAKLNIDA